MWLYIKPVYWSVHVCVLLSLSVVYDVHVDEWLLLLLVVVVVVHLYNAVSQNAANALRRQLRTKQKCFQLWAIFTALALPAPHVRRHRVNAGLSRA